MIRRGGSLRGRLQRLEAKAVASGGSYQTRAAVREDIILRLAAALLTDDELTGLVEFWHPFREEGLSPPEPPPPLDAAVWRTRRAAEAAYARGVRAAPDLLVGKGDLPENI